MNIETRALTDDFFDAALEKFAVVDDALVPRDALDRDVEPGEILDRYAFTAYVEALRSEEFDEDPLETVRDLELDATFADERAAWEAVKAFYADRACVLLRVGDTEEFIVGREVAEHLGLLGRDEPA